MPTSAPNYIDLWFVAEECTSLFDLSPDHHEFSWFFSHLALVWSFSLGNQCSNLSPKIAMVAPFAPIGNEVDFKISNKDDAGTAKGEFLGRSAKVGGVTRQSPKRFLY